MKEGDMSVAMQRERHPEMESYETTRPPGVVGSDQVDPKEARQLALLETILEDYRPAFRELANR